jgi:hypothetical protein
VVRGFDSMPPSKTIFAIKNATKNHEIRNKNHKKTMDTTIYVVEAGAGHVLWPLSKNPTTKNIKKNPTSKQWKQKAPVNNEEDRAMGESEEFFIHSLVKNLIVLQPGDKGL